MLTRLETFEWVFLHKFQAKAAANDKFEQRLSFLNGVIEFKWLLNKVHTRFINETN